MICSLFRSKLVLRPSVKHPSHNLTGYLSLEVKSLDFGLGLEIKCLGPGLGLEVKHLGLSS